MLVRFEELGAGGWDQWVPGVHGIAIDFDVGRRSYSATYLPFVAPEQGWGVRESGERRKARLPRFAKGQGVALTLPCLPSDARKLPSSENSLES